MSFPALEVFLRDYADSLPSLLQDYTQGSSDFTNAENYAIFNQFCNSGSSPSRITPTALPGADRTVRVVLSLPQATATPRPVTAPTTVEPTLTALPTPSS